jgi:hypothetical protein
MVSSSRGCHFELPTGTQFSDQLSRRLNRLINIFMAAKENPKGTFYF